MASLLSRRAIDGSVADFQYGILEIRMLFLQSRTALADRPGEELLG